MFCMKCGNQLEEGMRFCNKCGTPVENAAFAGTASDAFQSQQTAFMEPDYGVQNSYQQPMPQPTQPMPQPTQPTQPTQQMPQPWQQQAPYQQQGQQPYQQSYQQEYQQQAYVVPAAAQQAPAQKKPNKGLIIGIAAGVVAVAAVLVVLFVWPGVLKGGDSPSSSTANTPAASTQQNTGQGTGTASSGNSASGQSDSTGTQSDPKPDAQTDPKPDTQTDPKPDTTPAPANTFDSSKAESNARQAALDAGKEVFTGTVHLTNMYDRAKEIDSSLAEQFKGSSDVELAVLDLSSPTKIEARSAGDMGKLTTRAGGASLSLKDPSTWAPYDGKTITVAVHPVDMWYPSDVAGALYTVTAKNVVVIAPLTESTADKAIKDAGTLTEDTRQGIKDAEAAEKQDQQQQQPQQNTLNDYILPDSSTYAYSRSQLEQLSTHDLFLARNEIYARYGRQFVSQELKDYFGSKSWYHGTVAPDEFNDNWLNDTERHNVEMMLSIEQDRNSPYI